VDIGFSREKGPTKRFYFLVVVFILILALSIILPKYFEPSRDSRLYDVVTETTNIVNAVKKYTADKNGQLPGGDKCASAIKDMKNLGAGYMEEQFDERNAFDAAITTFCSENVFTITQTTNSESSPGITSSLESTSIINAVNGTIQTTISLD
jgi:hypothetical protein